MLARKLIKLFPDIDLLADCKLQDDLDGKGPYIKEWHRTELQPSQEELDAVSVPDNDIVQASIEADAQQRYRDIDEAITAATTIVALKTIIRELARMVY